MSFQYAVGSAHGRFQPFHMGHLEYCLATFDRCQFVWIGIAQFNIRNLAETQVAQHRSLAANNPFTYRQRVAMISGALDEARIDHARFAFVPFPIETPELLGDFFDLSIPVFTTVYDEWNEHKIKALQGLGAHVVVLWKRDYKEFEGAKIRGLIKSGDPGWRTMVPPYVYQFITHETETGDLADS